MQWINVFCHQLLLDSIHDKQLALRDLCDITYFLARLLTTDGVKSVTSVVTEIKTMYDQITQDIRSRRIELIHAFQTNILDVSMAHHASDPN
jgi:hypothetical protein